MREEQRRGRVQKKKTSSRKQMTTDIDNLKTRMARKDVV